VVAPISTWIACSFPHIGGETMNLKQFLSMVLFIMVLLFGSLSIVVPLAFIYGPDFTALLPIVVLAFPPIVAFVKLTGPFLAGLFIYALGDDEQ
jgi:hypothetical protein